MGRGWGGGGSTGISDPPPADTLTSALCMHLHYSPPGKLIKKFLSCHQVTATLCILNVSGRSIHWLSQYNSSAAV